MTAFTDRTLWRAAWQEFRLPWRWGWLLFPLIYLPILILGLIGQIISEFKTTCAPSAVLSVFLFGTLTAFLLGRAVPNVRPRQRRVTMLAWIPMQVVVIATASITCLYLHGSTPWGLGLFLLYHGLGRVAMITLDNPRLILVGLVMTMATSSWATMIWQDPEYWHRLFLGNPVLTWWMIAIGSGLVVASWLLDGRTGIQVPGTFLGWTVKQRYQIPDSSRMGNQRHFLAWWHDDLAQAPSVSMHSKQAQWLARWRLLPLSWWKLIVLETLLLVFIFLSVFAVVAVVTLPNGRVGLIEVKNIWTVSAGVLSLILLASASTLGWIAAAMARFHRLVPFADRQNLPRILLRTGVLASFLLALPGGVLGALIVGVAYPHLWFYVWMIPLILWTLMYAIFCHSVWLATVTIWVRFVPYALLGSAFGFLSSIDPAKNFLQYQVILISSLMVAMISGIWLAHRRLSRWEP